VTESRRSSAAGSEAPSVVSESPSITRFGLRAQRRASSEYEWEHKDGFGGHVPDSARNNRKYGKMKDRLVKQASMPASYDVEVDRWKRILQSYQSERRTPARPMTEVDEPAGLANHVRAKKPAWCENRAERYQPHLDGSKENFGFDFVFKDGYSGHVPETDKNRSKYGTTFGKVDKQTESEQWGRHLPGAAPVVEVLDRTGRRVRTSENDPRPRKNIGPRFTGDWDCVGVARDQKQRPHGLKKCGNGLQMYASSVVFG